MRARRAKEVEDVISGIRRQIRALETRAAGEDPWVAAEMVQLRDELDSAAVRTVKQLRDVGYRWDDIGFAFGVSGITCHKRYARKIV